MTEPGGGGWMQRGLLLALLLAAFSMTLIKMDRQPGQSRFVPRTNDAGSDVPPLFDTGFVSTGRTRLVHAPSLVELSDGRLMAFWFAGSREGAPDVVIDSAVYTPSRGRWSPERTVTTRQRTQLDTQRYVRKLGNPVPARDAAGTLWLFYVSAVGGWSTSSVNVMRSVDDGAHWGPARRLVTSPFLNISTLVKTVPFVYRDGTLGLPVYHEMAGKFGELLRLDRRGRVVSKQRLSRGRRTLQPLILIDDALKAIGLMRYSGPPPRRLERVTTDDGGAHWSPPEPSPLPNPDSAIAGAALRDGSRLLVLNHNEVMRDELSLLWADSNEHHWHVIFRFEDQSRLRGQRIAPADFAEEIQRLVRRTDPSADNPLDTVSAVRDTMCQGHPCRFQFDYPYLIQASDGLFHLLYTWNRAYIKHVRFNRQWLESMRRQVTE